METILCVLGVWAGMSLFFGTLLILFNPSTINRLSDVGLSYAFASLVSVPMTALTVLGAWLTSP